MIIYDENIGHATAYAYAKSKGYPWSEEQFAEDMANVGVNVHHIEEVIQYFTNITVPNATAAVESAGSAQVSIVEQTGLAAVSAVTSAGSSVLSEVTSTGSVILNGIIAEGSTQVTLITTAGTEQVQAVNSAGSTQVESVNSAGTTQISAIQTKGEQVLESIPQDYSKMSYLQELLHDEVADTVQEYTFVGGSVSQIKHKRGNIDIRTDVFTYGDGTITETRTLNSGQSVEIETNLETLETSVSYAE